MNEYLILNHYENYRDINKTAVADSGALHHPDLFGCEQLPESELRTFA